MKELVELWKKSVNWHQMTAKQKRLTVAFGVTASLAVVFINSWLVFPFGIVAASCYYLLEGENIEEGGEA